MKRLLAIILAALMMFALLATVVWADEVEDDATLEVEVEPEEPVISEEYVDTTDLTLYSDEIGDYHLYKYGAVKAYVRLNRDAVTAVVENGLIAVYDNNGNYINLDIAFNLSEHLWIEEIADEYFRQNAVYDENGMLIEAPEIGIPGYSPSYTGVEVEIEETHEDLFGCEIAVDYEAETDGIPREGYDGSAGTASNPNTGAAVAVAPAIFAALALIFKKR